MGVKWYFTSMHKQPKRNRVAAGVLFLALIPILASCREPRASEKGDHGSASLPAAPVWEPAFGTEGANALRYPVWMGEVPGKAGAFLVLERGGGAEDARIYAFTEKDGKWTRKVFLTVPVGSSAAASDERGLLGLAFHPDYAKNRCYFLYFMPKSRGSAPDSTVIDERRADASLLADGGGRSRRVLGIEQPFANHNGGSLAFGPKDGKLYIGTGDGGAGGDPRGYGQDLGSLLGKMLRIDVDDTAGGRAYGIPTDNPFVSGKGLTGGAARPEIWAYGLRNPWKWSFDGPTGDLWVGDVGQNNREEIAKVGRGENHGWRIMEGYACFDPAVDCPKEGLTLPIADLPRDEARSITGGYVYRGDATSPWHGAYFFGDWETKFWWVITQGQKQGETPRKLGRLPDQPASFGIDSRGNLYMVGYRKGILYRMKV